MGTGMGMARTRTSADRIHTNSMALGAGVRPGVVFDRAMESTDLVPTIGSMLDFSAALAQGKPIPELL